MSSFYGGKQGRTYHIVQRYDSVEQMVTAFSKGGAYTKANYGLYVIIDTVLNQGRSSSMENGLLYRRGFDYNNPYTPPPEKLPPAQESNEEFQQRWAEWVKNPGGGAIYVGQIVGPEGRSPEVSIEQWSAFLAQLADTGNFGSKSSVVINNYSSGKTDDEIQVGYINVKDLHGDVTGAYLAMNIPKLVMEAKVVNHGAYATAGVVETPASTSHPHWYKWDFTIPDGKHGRDFNSLTLEDGSQTLAEKDAEGKDIVSTDKYLTYSITDYENGSGNTPTPSSTYHLGRWPYRVIDNISIINKLREFSTFPSGYIAEVGDLYDFNITSENGNKICAVCIQGGSTSSTQLPQAKSFDNTLTYIIGWESQSNISKWRVVEIPEAAPACGLLVDYKAGPNTTLNPAFRNIDYITVDKLGDMYAIYSDGTLPTYLTNTGGLDKIVLSNDKLLIIYLKDDGTALESNTFDLKQVQSIQLENQNNINSRQYYSVTYASGTLRISNYLNNLLAVDLYGDNVIALYSDPDYRTNLLNGRLGIDYFRKDWTDNNGNSYSNLVWENLSSLRGQYHIQGEYTYADLEGDTTGSGFTIDLSGGFGTVPGLSDRAGWLATVIDSQLNRHLYAYDYNDTSENGKYVFPDGESTHWYEVMNIEASMIDPNLSVVVSDKNTPPTSLTTNGLWFVSYFGHDDNPTSGN